MCTAAETKIPDNFTQDLESWMTLSGYSSCERLYCLRLASDCALKLGMSWKSRKRNDIADILHAGDVH